MLHSMNSLLVKWAVFILITNFVMILYHVSSVSKNSEFCWTVNSISTVTLTSFFSGFEIVEFDPIHYLSFSTVDSLLVLFSKLVWPILE